MPPYSTGTPTRRQWLHGTAFAGLFATQPVWAQTSTKPAASKAATGPAIASVAQVIDMSAAQQDVSRDLLVGAQAAWKDFNARGGLRGRPVQHVALETDGSQAALVAAARWLVPIVATGNTVFPMLWDESKRSGPAVVESLRTTLPKLGFVAILIMLGTYTPDSITLLLRAVAQSIAGI